MERLVFVLVCLCAVGHYGVMARQSRLHRVLSKGQSQSRLLSEALQAELTGIDACGKKAGKDFMCKTEETCCCKGKKPWNTEGECKCFPNLSGDCSKLGVNKQPRASANGPAKAAPVITYKDCGSFCDRVTGAKLFGIELEQKKWILPFGIWQKECGTDSKWWTSESTRHEWYDKYGSQAMFVGKGDWANWEVHLDGGSRIIELVTKPVDAATLATELARLANKLKALKDDSATKTAIMKFLSIDPTFGEGNFVGGHSGVDESVSHVKGVDCIIRNGFMWSDAGGDSSAILVAPKALQITTSFTYADLRKISDLSGKSFGGVALNSVKNDCDMYKFLFGQGEFKKGEKPTDVLVKHSAEQLGVACGAKADPTKVESTVSADALKFDFKSKISEAWKLHTLANKPAKLLKRSGGDTAVIVEFRGMSPVKVGKLPVEQALAAKIEEAKDKTVDAAHFASVIAVLDPK